MKFEIAAALAATLLATSAFAQTPKLATDEMMVKSSDADIEIYARNKRPTDMPSFRPERTLLYVHGATYPASTAFDLPLGGQGPHGCNAAHPRIPARTLRGLVPHQAGAKH